MAPDEGECRCLGDAPVRDRFRCGEQFSQFCRRVVGGDIAVRVTHEQLARLDRHAGRTQPPSEGVPQVVNTLEHRLIDR